MKKALILVLMLFALYTPIQGNKIIGELSFEEDFQALLASAQDSEKLILIDFFTDWCKWCQTMADSTFPDPYVQKFLTNFELGMINAEIDTILAAKYGVRSYPTILLTKQNGTEIDRLIGYHKPEEFVTAIINSLAGIGTLEDLLEKAAADPENVELLYQVGEKHMYRGEYIRAKAYFSQVILLDSANTAGFASQGAYRMAYMQYKEKNYNTAAELYAAVAVDYPVSEQAVDAQLMIGYCYQKKNDHKKAKEAYNRFLKKYPETEERSWIEEQFEKMDK